MNTPINPITCDLCQRSTSAWAMCITPVRTIDVCETCWTNVFEVMITTPSREEPEA